jgi:hypothetical protein
MKKYLLPLSLLVLLVGACGPTVYLVPGFDDISATHQKVALLPFDVVFTDNKIKEETDPVVVREMEANMGYSMQDEAFSFLLREVSLGNVNIAFQDIDRTNALLDAAGIYYLDLRTIPKEEVAEILGVDAVLSGKAFVDKPFDEAAAAALGIVFGIWTATNTVETTLNLHNAGTGDLLWRYDWEASGSFGSTTEGLTRALMRSASRRFPY